MPTACTLIWLGTVFDLLISPIGAFAYFWSERRWAPYVPGWRLYWCSGGWVLRTCLAGYDLWADTRVLWLPRFVILLLVVPLHWWNFKTVMLKQFGVRVRFPWKVVGRV